MSGVAHLQPIVSLSPAAPSPAVPAPVSLSPGARAPASRTPGARAPAAPTCGPNHRGGDRPTHAKRAETNRGERSGRQTKREAVPSHPRGDVTRERNDDQRQLSAFNTRLVAM